MGFDDCEKLPFRAPVWNHPKSPDVDGAWARKALRTEERLHERACSLLKPSTSIRMQQQAGMALCDACEATSLTILALVAL